LNTSADPTETFGCHEMSESIDLDDLDRRILHSLQYDFPLQRRPYDVIARTVGVAVDELWQRIEKMTSAGVIRRIGVSLDSAKLGFAGTLAAVSVPADAVERSAKVIGAFAEVTHSYERRHRFNIWFTIIAVGQDRVLEILEQIRSALSLKPEQVLNLPMERLFKLDARVGAAGPQR